jgi:hypothetical protein
MKKIFFMLSMLLLIQLAYSQTVKYDSVAAVILDRMSNIIGDMQSCMFTAEIAQDTWDGEHRLIQENMTEIVHMAGPDKMMVNSYGPRGHREYWYNGTQLAYYSHDENNYGIIEAPPTIIATIDQVNTQYAIEFPAADFFYPAFTDDLIESADYVAFLGKAQIDGKECFHILATGKAQNIQLWISNDAFNLPAKYLIQYHKADGDIQYEATFSEWQVNPDLPLAMFEFMPPPGANKIRIVSTTEK